MRIAVASDHAGFRAKEALRRRLGELGHEVVDFGCADETSCDYPDFIVPAARAVAEGRCAFAFVFGGSGNGEAIAANKVAGIRAAVISDDFTAEMARRHNDANVGSFGSRVLPEERILRYAALFLATPFEGGRHVKRLEKIAALEKK